MSEKKCEKKDNGNNLLCCICKEKDRRIKVSEGDVKSTKCGSSKVPHGCPGFIPGNISEDRRD